jgi:hypothetical protein
MGVVVGETESRFGKGPRLIMAPPARQRFTVGGYLVNYFLKIGLQLRLWLTG